MEVTSRVNKTEIDAIKWALNDIAQQLGKSTNPRFREGIKELRKVSERLLHAVGLASGSPKRPKVTCLCGSTRFHAQFVEANLEETLAGRIVLSIGAAVASDEEHFGHLSQKEQADIKKKLDELHLRKIDLADEVLILNFEGYIGESTGRELEYARAHGKVIRFLEDPDAVKDTPPPVLVEVEAELETASA